MAERDRIPTSFDNGVHPLHLVNVRRAPGGGRTCLYHQRADKGNLVRAFTLRGRRRGWLTREKLPMIGTVNLAKVTWRCRATKSSSSVSAIQNFGAMEVLCTNKTDTLTQGRNAMSTPGRRSDQVFEYAGRLGTFEAGSVSDASVLGRIHRGCSCRDVPAARVYLLVADAPPVFALRSVNSVVRDFVRPMSALGHCIGVDSAASSGYRDNTARR